ncbi:MAG: hypothetical protein QG671_777, partial [Actinomycetota bacterium]|nr:hypothetical protein [Actinomycetota bacterium]
DDPDAPRYDTRLRDRCLYTVLRKLMLASGGRKGRGGFISYAQLGINQLGAVYEGLMSYTGTIAAEELLEVAKNGERDGDKDGSWLIPASKADQYPDSAFVSDPDPETGVRSRRRHETGSFVFRLAGRDIDYSASYSSPESLTRTVVQLTLAERLDQDGVVTRAAEMLDWTICEPALGSGAFLNEAINQVAAEYLRRRQAELGETIPDEDYRIELQRTKAYLALHNCYGVDLNDTAVELAEVSVWLNVMHKGLQAPWLGLHLRRGDSLIGCTRTTYTHAQVTTATWANETPERLPLTERELPDGRVHQFLLPSSGWGVAATTKEAKELDGERAKRLSAWRRTMLRKPTEAQARRLTALAVRVEQLWELVRARVELSEQQVRRDLPVWGAERRPAVAAIRTREQVRADLFRVGSPYWRLKTLMDVWCALWFAPTHLVDTFASIEALILPPTPLPAIPPDDAPAPLPQPQQSGSPALRTAPGQGALISDLELTGVEELTLFDSLGLVDEQKVQEAEERELRREAARLAKERKALAASLAAVSTIPLTSLADWLDFAEALLGVKDKPSKRGENLLQQFTSLDDLDAYENTIPIRFRCLEATQIATRFPWLQPLQEIAADRGFFHWDLDFVRPMSSGGFDLQVGNPPWVRPDWDERLVLAENDPWFGLIEKPDRGEWDRHRKRLLSSETTTDEYLQESALVAGCSNSLSHSTTYPLITGTRPNLYRAFMCRAWANQHRQGTTGLLHPDTHFNGSKEAPLRSASYRHLRIHADFVNSSHRFFPPPIGHSTHIGLQIYGYPHDPDFVHLSWILDPNTLIESILAYRNGHPGASELIPGVKFEGDWDIRPHPSRVVRATLDTLRHWQSVLGDKGDPSSARLLNPLTTHEEEVLAILANYPDRLSASNPAVTNGFDEGLAKRTRLIQWQPSKPSDWEDVVLKGPQIGVATPILKSPIENEGSRPTDLMTLPADYVPPTPYRRICSKEQFEKSQDQWHDMDGTTRKSSDFFRAAWRCQIASDTDRSLFMALIPRSVSHVDGLQSGRLANTQLTALWSGMWSTLPIDYLLRVMGSSHLRLSNARAMPAPRSDHPLAPALLLRTMRMNCLTTAWSPLWEELYRPSWQSDSWAFEWPGTQDLQTIGPQWNVGTPLRSDRERRAALVEMDALVAVWLGLTASQLISIYLSRFPVLNQYESAMWFSSSGCRLSPHHNIYGAGQTKEHWGQLQAYLEDPASNPPPEGFPPPYYKADRVAEMRQAHEVFTKRLAAGSSAALDDERAPSWPAKTPAKSVEAGR